MKRPGSVTILGWFFIAAGALGFAYHATELDIRNPFAGDAAWVLFVRLLAVAGGVLVLRGSNAGRWLLILWAAYHVVLSYFHSMSGLVVHALLLAAIIFLFFQPRVVAYFNQR
ncbi:MAG TPA: hypothetical protein VF490_16910 [Chryseosolibacter sp.]